MMTPRCWLSQHRRILPSHSRTLRSTLTKAGFQPIATTIDNNNGCYCSSLAVLLDGTKEPKYCSEKAPIVNPTFSLKHTPYSKSALYQEKQARHHQQYNRLFSTDNNKQYNNPSPSLKDSEGEEETEELPVCLLPYTGIPSHPDAIELKPGQRLVAIGDIHGDFDQLLNALLIAGVVAEEDFEDEEGSDGRGFVWIGGDAVLVQVGDCLDRGPHELQCWQLLADLARQAQTQGGAVIFLFGNHELWTSVGFYQLDHERYMQNLDYDDGIDDEFEVEFGDHLELSIGKMEEDWRYARTLHHIVTNGVALHPRKVAARWAAMEPGGLLAKHFLSNFKIAVKVGQTILVHAGIAPEHLTRFGGIQGMNETTKRWILKKGPKVGRRHMLVPSNDSEGRMRTYMMSMPDFFMEGDDNDFSPIWMRDYSDPPDGIPHNPAAPQMLGTLY